MDNKTKVLLFDIETMANLGYVWQKYEQNVIAYEKEWYMLSVAWKWLGEKTTHVISLPDFKGYSKDKTNDKELVKALWKLFDEADIIIAHNGNSFDIKKSNAKFIEHGLPVPSPYKQIDTKLIARRYFNFNSNKLDDLGNILGLGRKIDTGGFDLWLGCASGNKKAWKKMCEYNKQDVILLEKIYLKMRGWITPLKSSKHHGVCTNLDCGGVQFTRRGTEVRLGGIKVQRLVCNACGKWSYGEVLEKISKK